MLSCLDARGTPVLIGESLSLNNVGYASFLAAGNLWLPVIVFNPLVLRTYDPRTQVFWFAHECAHHALGHVLGGSMGVRSPRAEVDADCLAAKALRWSYGFGPSDVSAVALSIVSLPGSAAGHLPGFQRAMHIMRCAAD
jgi:hypothetical protein